MEATNHTLLKRTFEACKRVFYVIGIFTFFINLFALALPLYMLQLYNRVLSSGSGETLFYLSILVIIILLTTSGLEIARARLLNYMSHWLDNKLGPPAIADSADELLLGSRYGAQVLSDITLIRQFFASPAIFAFFDSPWVPIYLIVIFFLSPYLGVIATLGAMSLFSLAYFNESYNRSRIREANAKAINCQKYMDTALRNAEVIQAMGMMPAIIDQWKTRNEPVLELQDHINNSAGIINSLTRFLRMFLQVLMLAVGAYLVIENRLSAGAMFAGSILLSRALAPVEQAIAVWKQFVSTRDAYNRVKIYFAKQQFRPTSIELPKPVGKLSIENVTYYIPKETKPLLFNISFEVLPGEIISIVGPSGAGKSTLARLMTGALKSTQGTIRLDSADVFTWERSDFGKHLGYLPQDIELFSGSIKENIARLNPEDDKKIVDAAILSGCHEMILKFPNSYDTIINIDQFTLSGGQRQRIALARALYNSPKLIILDEPNSNLDTEGEIALLKALLKLKELKSTIVLVTHKTSIIKHTDKILILKAGQVQEYGPTLDVLKKFEPPKSPIGKPNGST